FLRPDDYQAFLLGICGGLNYYFWMNTVRIRSEYKTTKYKIMYGFESVRLNAEELFDIER
ncbi:TPA: hypothetical protein ACX6FV_002352, partial [Vibrio cholerae]